MRRNAGKIPVEIDRNAEAKRRNRELFFQNKPSSDGATQRERKLKIQLPKPDKVSRSNAMRDLNRTDEDYYIELFG